jgi:hypothetical protein
LGRLPEELIYRFPDKAQDRSPFWAKERKRTFQEL